MLKMSARVLDDLIQFGVEEIPQLINELEAVRLSLVRLNSRNRPRIQQKSDVVLKPTDPTSKTEVVLVNTPKWIDSDGRHFIWLPKNRVHPEDFPLRKNSRRRPTHRGRRKKRTTLGVLLRKLQSTASQLVPEAKQLPLRIQKLISVLVDAAQFSEKCLEALQPQPNQLLTSTSTNSLRHRSRHKLLEGV